jgi:hypothetical protein
MRVNMSANLRLPWLERRHRPLLRANLEGRPIRCMLTGIRGRGNSHGPGLNDRGGYSI